MSSIVPSRFQKPRSPTHDVRCQHTLPSKEQSACQARSKNTCPVQSQVHCCMFCNILTVRFERMQHQLPHATLGTNGNEVFPCQQLAPNVSTSNLENSEHHQLLRCKLSDEPSKHVLNLWSTQKYFTGHTSFLHQTKLPANFSHYEHHVVRQRPPNTPAQQFQSHTR